MANLLYPGLLSDLSLSHNGAIPENCLSCFQKPQTTRKTLNEKNKKRRRSSTKTSSRRQNSSQSQNGKLQFSSVSVFFHRNFQPSKGISHRFLLSHLCGSHHEIAVPSAKTTTVRSGHVQRANPSNRQPADTDPEKPTAREVGTCHPRRVCVRQPEIGNWPSKLAILAPCPTNAYTTHKRAYFQLAHSATGRPRPAHSRGSGPKKKVGWRLTVTSTTRGKCLRALFVAVDTESD